MTLLTSQPNAQYNVAKPNSFVINIAKWQRKRMYRAFLTSASAMPTHTLLDVGVNSDQTYSHSNYIEAWYPHKDRITAVGIDDAGFLEKLYDGLRFIRADGRDLPFPDRSFDHVHSSAVLEHVGSRDRQAQFLRELWRVTRRTLFVTTPNRFFPIEFHTVLPLIHWLPARVFRGLLRRIGHGFFAEEDNLNLLAASDLRRVAVAAGIAGAHVGSVRLLGWRSNLLLVARRPDAG